MITHHPAARAAPVVRMRVSSETLRAAAATLALVGGLLPSAGGISLSTVGLAVAAVFAGVEIVRALPKLHPVLPNTLALFVLLSCSALWTELPGDYGEAKLTTLLTATMLSTLIAAAIRGGDDLTRLAIVWPVVMVPIAIDTLISFEGGRTGAFGANPIWAARALTTGVIFALWYIWSAPGARHRALMLGVVVILGGALVATGARGPLLGLAIAVLILALVTSRGRTQKLAAIVYGVTILGYGVVYRDVFATSRVVDSLQRGAFFTDNGRDRLLSAAVDIIRTHPWGVGIGNIGNHWTSHFPYPHNIFVEVLAEHGWLVGTIFMVVTATTMIRLLARARANTHVLLLAALLGAEIANVSFSGDLNARSFFFFLMLALWVLFWGRHVRTPPPAPAGPLSASPPRPPAQQPAPYRRRMRDPS